MVSCGAPKRATFRVWAPPYESLRLKVEAKACRRDALLEEEHGGVTLEELGRQPGRRGLQRGLQRGGGGGGGGVHG